MGELSKLYVSVGSEFDGKGMDAANAAVDKLSDKTGVLDGIFSHFVITAGDVVNGIKFVGEQLYKVIDAAGEAETAQHKLNEALQTAGIYSDELSTYFEDLAMQFQDTTVFSDEQVKSVEQLILRFGVAPSKIASVTKAVLDLSRGMGIDLETATRMVVKANDGMATSFNRVGIKLDESKLKTQGLDYVVQEIAKHFGDSAKNELNTYEGRVKNLGNRWDEFKEQLGKGVLPLANSFLTVAIATVSEQTKWGEALGYIDNKKSVVDSYKTTLAEVNERIEKYYELSRSGVTLDKDMQDGFRLLTQERKDLTERIKEATTVHEAHNKVLLKTADANDTITAAMKAATAEELARKEAMDRDHDASVTAIKDFNAYIDKMNEYVDIAKNTLASSFATILKEGQNLSDAMTTIGTGIKDAIINAVAKAAADWVVEMAIMQASAVASAAVAAAAWVVALAPVLAAIAAILAVIALVANIGKSEAGAKTEEEAKQKKDMGWYEWAQDNELANTTTTKDDTHTQQHGNLWWREGGYENYQRWQTEIDAMKNSGYASGGKGILGGLITVGENGRELMQVPDGTNIYSNGQTEDIFKRMELAGSGGMTLNISVPPIPSPGYARQMARIIGNEIHKGLKNNRRLDI